MLSIRRPIGCCLDQVIVLLIIVLACPACWAATYYVSPGGSDTADGSQLHPWASPAKAIIASRQVATGEKRVVLRGGNYFNAKLTITSADSGLSLEAFPGEVPVLVGGQRLTNWSYFGSNTYFAQLPPLPANSDLASWEVRMLLADGQIVPRARFPETGYLTSQNRFTVRWVSTSGGGWERPPTTEELTVLKYQAAELPFAIDRTNAEITVLHQWDESTIGVAAQNRASNTVTLAPAPTFPPGAFGVNSYALWNLPQGLTRAGQWYHDRSRGGIVYRAAEGEDPSQKNIIVPSICNILKIQGSSASKVRDLRLKGLVFSVTTVPLVPGGYSAANYEGALTIDQTSNCAFDRLTVGNVAGYGVMARSPSNTGLTVRNCTFSDCGAGGIYYRGDGLNFENNLIRNVGFQYVGGVGVYAGGARNRISGNEISGGGYCGVSLMGQEPLVERNLVYSFMKHLADGGGVYATFSQGARILNNDLWDMSDDGKKKTFAVYLDEQCTSCVVSNNLILGVRWPLMNHMSTNNSLLNNVLYSFGDMRISFPVSQRYTIERNVFHYNGGLTIDQSGAVLDWSKNLFHNPFEDRYGVPATAVFAAPGFVSPEHLDFAYQAGSPALALGVKPIDAFQAGRTPLQNPVAPRAIRFTAAHQP